MGARWHRRLRDGSFRQPYFPGFRARGPGQAWSVQVPVREFRYENGPWLVNTDLCSGLAVDDAAVRIKDKDSFDTLKFTVGGREFSLKGFPLP